MPPMFLQFQCSVNGTFETPNWRKRARHVALVGEAARGGGLREVGAVADQMARTLGALQHEPRMRRHTVGFLETAQHLVGAEARHRREFGERGRGEQLVGEAFAHPLHIGSGFARWRGGGVVVAQQAADFGQRFFAGECFGTACIGCIACEDAPIVESAEQAAQRVAEPRVLDDGARQQLEGHHFLALLAQALDAQRHDVALLQEQRRLHAHADAGRRAGGDDVAGQQRHELAHVAHHLGGAEDHGLGVAGLHALAVDVQPHVERCTFSISSVVTSHGPSGPKVSQPLPLSQVPPRSSWNSRSLTSLMVQ
jgi:hypothetical protein